MKTINFVVPVGQGFSKGGPLAKSCHPIIACGLALPHFLKQSNRKSGSAYQYMKN